MSHVSVGAKTLDGQHVKTKKALKTLLLGDKRSGVEAQPSEVLLYVTDLLGPCVGQQFRGDTLPIEHTLRVVGPDPYNHRVWYASVSVTNKGIVVN